MITPKEQTGAESIVYLAGTGTRSSSFTKPGFKNQTALELTITSSDHAALSEQAPACAKSKRPDDHNLCRLWLCERHVGAEHDINKPWIGVIKLHWVRPRVWRAGFGSDCNRSKVGEMKLHCMRPQGWQQLVASFLSHATMQVAPGPRTYFEKEEKRSYFCRTRPGWRHMN